MPFSAAATATLESVTVRTLRVLVAEAQGIALRHGADTVSATDVKQAHRYLVTPPANWLQRHLGMIGGVLLGSGVSTLISLAIAETLDRTPTLLAAAVGIVGAYLVASCVAKA